MHRQRRSIGCMPCVFSIPATVEVMGACGFSFRNESYESLLCDATALAVQKPYWTMDEIFGKISGSERERGRHNNGSISSQ